MAAPVAAVKAKKTKKMLSSGRAHILATFNNTLITITSSQGDVYTWSTAAKEGFKGSRKSTPFAAQTASEKAARAAFDGGVRTLEVIVKGPGPGRESALRALGGVGLQITKITDRTPIAHNGCRKPKKRRV